MTDISHIFAILIHVINVQMGLSQMYTFHSSPESWTNAAKICEADGKRLLAILTPDSLKLLQDDAAFNKTWLKSEMWIGLSTTADDCTSHSWHGGGCLGPYRNWDSFEPNACRTDKCVRIVKTKWRTMTCTSRYQYICENFERDMTTSTPINITKTSATSARVVIATTHTNCSTACSLLPSVTSGLYGTVCSEITLQDNITTTSEALEKEIQKLKQELTVTKTTTNLYLRSKTSMYEKRTSAMTMGVIGVTVIIVVISLLVLSDIIGVIRYIFKNLR